MYCSKTISFDKNMYAILVNSRLYEEKVIDSMKLNTITGKKSFN